MRFARVVLVVLLMVVALPLMAQRRGAVEMGGTFSFQSGSSAMEDNSSQLIFNWLIASYLNRNYAIEIEPSFLVTFADDSINVSSLVLLGVGKRLVDLSPNIPRNKQNRHYELGTAASVFGSIGAGLWISGVALPTRPGVNYTGPAVYAGLSTHTYLGSMTSLRVGLKYIYLFPSGNVYTRSRTVWQVGVGFSIFLHI